MKHLAVLLTVGALITQSAGAAVAAPLSASGSPAIAILSELPEEITGTDDADVAETEAEPAADDQEAPDTEAGTPDSEAGPAETGPDDQEAAPTENEGPEPDADSDDPPAEQDEDPEAPHDGPEDPPAGSDTPAAATPESDPFTYYYWRSPWYDTSRERNDRELEYRGLQWETEYQTTAAATRLMRIGLVQGRSAGATTIDDLSLDATITRAELMVVMARAFGLAHRVGKEPIKTDLYDIQYHWSRDYVAIMDELAQQNGFKLGITENLFGPDGPVTNIEAAAFLMKFLSVPPDAGDGLPWPYNYEKAAVEADILRGYVKDPWAPATRGEVFVTLDNAFSQHRLSDGKTVYQQSYRHYTPELAQLPEPRIESITIEDIPGMELDGTVTSSQAIGVRVKASGLFTFAPHYGLLRLHDGGRTSIPIDPDTGIAERMLYLSEGENRIEVIVEDALGRQATEVITITRISPENDPNLAQKRQNLIPVFQQIEQLVKEYRKTNDGEWPYLRWELLPIEDDRRPWLDMTLLVPDPIERQALLAIDRYGFTVEVNFGVLEGPDGELIVFAADTRTLVTPKIYTADDLEAKEWLLDVQRRLQQQKQ